MSPASEDWKASGAYYKAKNPPGLVDFTPCDQGGALLKFLLNNL